MAAAAASAGGGGDSTSNSNHARKRLVLFAGPHKAASSSVEEFFYTWASGDHTPHTEGYKETFALRKWIWPRINGTIVNDIKTQNPTLPTYKLFSLLVTMDNPALEQEILESIRMAWELSDNGIILGTEEFDHVGPQSFTYDALKVVKKIVKHLNVEQEMVTIVLNYRIPRFDQWMSIWKHTTVVTDDDNNSNNNKKTSSMINKNVTYAQFLCDPETQDKRIESLATEMNPLQVAQVYFKEGYKIILIDLGGVDQVNRDISHVIACDVLGAACDDGNLRHHDEYKPQNNKLELEELETHLDDDDLKRAEQLFLYRDCALERSLRDHANFQVLLNQTVWSNCHSKLDTKVYQKLLNDARILHRALLSQVVQQCPMSHKIKRSHMISMDQALQGDIPILPPYNPRSNDDRMGDKVVVEAKGGIPLIVEAILMPTILLCIVAYQIMVMYNKKLQSQPSSSSGTTATTKNQSEMVKLKSSQVNAEYGDVDDDDDDDSEAMRRRK